MNIKQTKVLENMVYKKIKWLVMGALLVNLIYLVSCAGGSNDNGVDNTPPSIVLVGSESLSIQVGSSYIEEGAIATDNVDGLIEVEITNDLDISRIGSYIVTYTATDVAGNTSSITRNIEVEATTVNKKAFEGVWLSDCIIGEDNNFIVTMEISESANDGFIKIRGFDDECITQDYEASLDISLSYPGSHTSSVCTNAVKINGRVKYPINVLITGQAQTLSISDELSLNSLGFFESDFLVAYDLMCTNELGTILYSGFLTSENDGSSDFRRPIGIDTDGFWRKQ